VASCTPTLFGIASIMCNLTSSISMQQEVRRPGCVSPCARHPRERMCVSQRVCVFVSLCAKCACVCVVVC
jgi:hypothetical protein